MPLGVHQSFYGLRELVSDCRDMHNNTFQFFIRNNRNTRMREFSYYEIDEFNKLLFESEITRYVIHASYALNPASYEDDKRNNALRVIKEDLDLINKLGGVTYYVLHPGAYTDNSRIDALRLLALSMKELEPHFGKTVMCLEMMAGQGTQLFRSIDDAKLVLNCVDSVQLCADTCHLFGAGITVEEYLSELGSRTGVIHVNDSVRPFGSNLDRHANISYGMIGEEQLAESVKKLHEANVNAPIILETPAEHIGSDLAWLKNVIYGGLKDDST